MTEPNVTENPTEPKEESSAQEETPLPKNEKTSSKNEAPSTLEEDDTSEESSEEETLSPKQESSVESVLEMLLQGKKIHNVSIGRLNLQKKIFEHPVVFEHCEIHDIDLGRAVFKSTVLFSRCKINRLNAHQTRFEKHLTITKCEFMANAVFKKCQMQDGIRFIGNRVFCGLSFTSSTFSAYSGASKRNPDANFADNVYSTPSQINFFRCKFEGYVRHWGSVFNAWAEFKESVFEGTADFRSVKFNEGVFFTGATFKQPALFRGSVFELRTDFNECTFENEVDFSKAKLRDFLYLQDVKWVDSPTAGFRFHNMLVERMIVSREALTQHLLSEKEQNFSEAADVYAIVRSNFERINRYDDEDWAYLKQKQHQRRALYKNSKNPWKKLREFTEWVVLDLGCGYGTDPFRAIRSAFVVISLFAVCYFFSFSHLLEPDHFEQVKDLHPVLKAAAAFNISLLVFTSGYADIKVVPDHWVGLLFPLEFMLGIVLLGLFVVSFSRKVIRS